MKSLRSYLILTAWITATLIELVMEKPWRALTRKFPILTHL